MTKRISILLIIILLTFLILPISASASEIDLGVQKSYIMDTAGLLTDEQQQILEVRAKELSNTYGCDVRLVTLNDIGSFGYNVIEYFAYDTYLEYDFGYGEGKDCVLLVLSTADREYDFRVWGDYAQRVFTLYGIDNILDKHILVELQNNDYYAAFTKYFDRSELYFKMESKGKAFDSMTNPATKATIMIVTIILALLLALIICNVWKRQMKTANIAKTATNYIPEGGFKLTGQSDVFTYRTVSRVKIETSSSSSSSSSHASSGGSGGSSGRSGHY